MDRRSWWVCFPRRRRVLGLRAPHEAWDGVLAEEPVSAGVKVPRPQQVEGRLAVSLFTSEQPVVRTAPSLGANRIVHFTYGGRLFPTDH
jgi:hypothetical protein